MDHIEDTGKKKEFRDPRRGYAIFAGASPFVFALRAFSSAGGQFYSYIDKTIQTEIFRQETLTLTDFFFYVYI